MASAPDAGPEFTVPEHELEYRVSRSGGPGGQHVNTSSTRVELRWDIASSASLSEEQRARLLARLKPRLDRSGRLRVVSSASRSQLQNRKDVRSRLDRLVLAALVVPRARKKTRPGRAAKERRLANKKAHSAKKEQRRRPTDE